MSQIESGFDDPTQPAAQPPWRPMILGEFTESGDECSAMFSEWLPCIPGKVVGTEVRPGLMFRTRRPLPSAPPDSGLAGSGDALNTLAAVIHELNAKWWHDETGARLERNKGELLCLIHSEISEAMEGERKSLMDDKLPHRSMSEVELADALIRILDYSHGFGYDIGGAVVEKLEFNKTRADHSYEERAKPSGKKW